MIVKPEVSTIEDTLGEELTLFDISQQQKQLQKDLNSKIDALDDNLRVTKKYA